MRYLLAFMLALALMPVIGPLADAYQSAKAGTQRDALPRHHNP